MIETSIIFLHIAYIYELRLIALLMHFLRFALWFDVLSDIVIKFMSRINKLDKMDKNIATTVVNKQAMYSQIVHVLRILLLKGRNANIIIINCCHAIIMAHWLRLSYVASENVGFIP